MFCLKNTGSRRRANTPFVTKLMEINYALRVAVYCVHKDVHGHVDTCRDKCSAVISFRLPLTVYALSKRAAEWKCKSQMFTAMDKSAINSMVSQTIMDKVYLFTAIQF